MTINRIRTGALGFALGMLSFASTANAQATRTWVSGVGDDANPCSRTAPCKTLAGAISKTMAGGEIDVMDPAGVGALTITKAITIDGGIGSSVLVSGTNGIVVNAPPTDVVTIRNLAITGQKTGINGIQYNTGADLHVENCKIFGFQTAINVAGSLTGKLTVENSTIADNSVAGIGITTTATVSAVLNGTHIMNSVTGISAQNGSFVTLNNCDIEHNTTGIKQSNMAGATSQVTVVGSVIAFNTTALQSVAGALIVSSANALVGNGTIFSPSGGQIFSTGDNVNSGNGTVGTTPTSLPKI
jgi:hypothetical protein